MAEANNKAAHEALANEVKALREEVKRLRNARSTLEVELQPKQEKRSEKRSSWADAFKETATLRKSKMLLGQENKTDDGLEGRVKWGQRGAGTFGILTLICYVAGQATAAIVFMVFVLLFAGLLYYKTSRSLLQNGCYGSQTW